MSSNKKEKMTFLQWIDNVWYHYKPQIIIGAFAIVLVSVALSQCIKKEKYDAFIYVAGADGLTAMESDLFTEEMESKFTVDANGDGKKVVDLKVEEFTMAVGPDGNAGVFNPEKQVSEIGSFQIELSKGDCVIYLLQKEFFYPNLKYFASLESTIGYVPENAINGKGIRLGDLEAYWTTDTLKYFPEDYIICLADKEKRLDARYYEGNVKFFKKLIEYEHTTE